MKKNIIFLVLLSATQMAFSQTKPPKVDINTLPSFALRSQPNSAFQAGECVKYRIHYGLIDAGEATLRVEESPYKFGNRDAFRVIGEGRSLGSFDWFFKVRDYYETYIDKQGIFPYRFIRNVDEGGYKINQDYTFYQDKRAYKDEKGESYSTPEYIQDMLSAYYYARTIDYSQFKPGDVVTINSVVDGEVYPLKMKYIGKETVKVDVGKFKCLRFAPVVQKGRVFKKEEDLSVWITDDPNHLPILAQAKIMVGSIKMELKQYSGLSSPIAQVN